MALARISSHVLQSMTTVRCSHRFFNPFISRIACARFSNIHQQRDTMKRGLIGIQFTYFNHYLFINRILTLTMQRFIYKSYPTYSNNSVVSCRSISHRFLMTPTFLAPLIMFRKVHAESHPDGEINRIKTLLNKKPERRALDESIELFNCLIRKGEEEVKKAKNKDIVIFLGDTGAGKGVLINFLYGCTMIEVGSKIVVDPKSPIKEVTEIGTTIDSCTFIPKQIPDISIKISVSEDKQQNVTFAFFDMPGLTETRGVEVALANAIIMKQMVKCANSVRFVMVSDRAALKLERGKHWVESVKSIKEQFNDSLGYESNSLCLVITKTKDSLEDSLDKVKNEIKSYLPKTLLDLSNYADVYNPLDPGDRKRLLKILFNTKTYGKEQGLDTKVSMRDDQLWNAYKLGKKVSKGIENYLEEGDDGINEAIKKLKFTQEIANLGNENLVNLRDSAATAVEKHVEKIVAEIDPRKNAEITIQFKSFNRYKVLKSKFSPFVKFEKFDSDVRIRILGIPDKRWVAWDQPDTAVVCFVATLALALIAVFFAKKDDNKAAGVTGVGAVCTFIATIVAGNRLLRPSEEDQMRYFCRV